MCSLHDPIPAVVISPRLPEPPVTGGQKRTLRLLEAMARSGLSPRILTTDAGEEGAAERLRMRGWVVEIVPEPPRSPIDRMRQHARRLPSPYLPSVAACLGELAAGAALVQYEHTQAAYYAAPPGVPTVLSLHNFDSAAASSSAAGRKGVAWLREHNRAAALRAVERRVSRRPTACCASPQDDALSVSRAGGRAILAPNGVDDEFFGVACPGDEDRVLFFGHFGYEANRRGIERFLAEGWPELRRVRPNARLALAGGGLEADAFRVDGVDVLGLVADLPAVVANARAVVVPIWEGGGHAAEGARGARRRARRRLDAARRLRHRVRARPPRAAGGIAGGARGRARDRAGRSAASLDPGCETAGFWPNITAGKRRFQARRRSTRK